MDNELKEYRSSLLQTVQKLNENYDKLIITLSGGAFGLSIAFMKDVINQDQIQQPVLLVYSWGLFILSLTAVLGALLFGIAANKKAIKQVDAGKIYDERPGGIFSKLTIFSHYLGTVFLLAGLALTVIFVHVNMEVKNVKRPNSNPAKATNQGSPETKPK